MSRAADRRLAAIGARLLLLSAAPETIWERGVWPRRDDEFITGYALRSFGSSLAAIHRHFVEEQEAMRAALPRTRLEQRTVCVDGALDAYLEEAADFWER